MNQRNFAFALLLCLAAVAAGGCQRNIVSAAPPSVASPPPPEPPPQPTVPAASAESASEPPPEVTAAPAPTPAPAVKSAQPRPRPPAEVADAPKPKPEPEPAPPQIAPALSPRQLADAQRRTNSDIVAAEKNLDHIVGRQLLGDQKDLADKVRSFLEQAHQAVQVSDWVRAENLAHKALILSTELVKSLP